MSDYNVHRKKGPGPTTQYMSENFSDLANLANEKLLNQGISKEQKLEVLKEVRACLELAQEKADKIPQSPKLQKIMARVKSVSESLEDFMDHM
ncbi:MAG: hypothetical protein NE327_07840 [Lentisphaeraceae bacterium]|nr:hypothetical protein [Lentisphaeraceae bacterium]